MASKKEVLELVVGIIEGKVDEETMASVVEALKPKAGGGGSVEDYTVFDTDGNVTHIMCTVLKKWLPLTDEEGELLFKEDTKGKNGYHRYSIEGGKAWNAAAKAFKASKDGIMQDLLEGEIDNVEAQNLLKEAEDARKAPFEVSEAIAELILDDKPETEAVA